MDWSSANIVLPAYIFFSHTLFSLLGGNDFEAGEGNWIWTSSKIPLEAGYQDWTRNEPNNKGSNGREENCLNMNRYVFLSIMACST